MDRYLLFGFSFYYPAGGWSDFIGSFPTLELANIAFEANTEKEERLQIVDLETKETIRFESW